MTTHSPISRWEEIKTIWQQNQWLYAVGGFLLGLLAYPAGDRLISDLFVLLGDLVPEAVGIVVTVFIIERFNANREESRRIRERNERLVREIGSRVNDIAKQAVDEARKLGLLYSGSQMLKGVNLDLADLEDTNLSGLDLKDNHFDLANLNRVNFSYANLKGAYFFRAKLTDADLSMANLFSVYARLADFNGADFQNTNLQHAKLTESNLCNVNFCGANLVNALISGIEMNENTILPDAEVISFDKDGNFIYDKYWTPETDMTRYTDPEHPDFWQPDWVKAGKPS